MAAAITCTSLLANGQSGGTGVTTSSVSLTAGNLYVLVIASKVASGTANAATCSGASQTWVASSHLDSGGSSLRRMTFLRCQPTSNASGALTIGFSGQTQGSFEWSLVGLDNVTVGNNGADAIVQGPTFDDSGNVAVTSQSVTLSTFQRTNNACVCVGAAPNAAAALTAKSGFTSKSNTNASGGHAMLTEFKATPDASPNVGIDSKVVENVVAIEVRQAQPSSYAYII